MNANPLRPPEVDVEELYVKPAMQRIEAVVEEQLAATRLEIQSRISEGYFSESGQNIEPHHVTTALLEVTRTGVIRSSHAMSKAQHEVEIFTPAKLSRRETRVAKASQRKRALAARFQSWGSGTQRHRSGLLGPAGEAAVRRSLEAASSTQPMIPGFGAVSRPLGVEVPGPFDSGVYVTPLADGIPTTPITVPIEVKNIRGWIYPSSHELYQLLWKASLVQQSVPQALICPILICRKAHYTTFVMAKTLGFLVFETKQQYLPETVDQRHVDEVRTELYFHDLTRSAQPNDHVVNGFRKTLPGQAPVKGASWQQTCRHPEIIQLFSQLRHEDSRYRESIMETLRTMTLERGLSNGGW